jgi:hypothetical protein
MKMKHMKKVTVRPAISSISLFIQDIIDAVTAFINTIVDLFNAFLGGTLS